MVAQMNIYEITVPGGPIEHLVAPAESAEEAIAAAQGVGIKGQLSAVSLGNRKWKVIVL